MATTAIITYFHFIGIIMLFISLTVERLLFKKEVDQVTARRIMRFDALYGMAAVLILLTGFLKYYLYGKGVGYYSHNYIMWTKIGLFILVGLLSIYPTIYFLKWRKLLKSGEPIVIQEKEYKMISMFIHLELGIAVMIPLLATLMARGFGI